ncbi:FAA hydrolase family protein [Spiribacter sp. C176]|uniref:FAA hydrolase family protein n=1 Tax=Spiribacter salilacus TaxID=2664894 RepID=A0A6N7QPV1_9GAMM|nr:fumarylacetoacetate hydrolase family protein [Spiribacter salilacus]MRH78431.1 FAA hydrolase family protein [Spiribacter salilacus]
MSQQYVFPPAERWTIPTTEGQGFPVRRVYCVGRNYAAHAIEMGHDPNAEPPFFFQKNPENLDSSGSFPYPQQSEDVHHEVELLVALQSGGVGVCVEDALDMVWGYAPALDMTCRDLQADAKKRGRPWVSAKAFESSAPCGLLVPAQTTGQPSTGAITLDVNGDRRQEGDLSQLIWKVPEVISFLSRQFALAAGDVILTGTPAGVGPVQRGDELVASVEGVGAFSVRVY